MADERFVLRLAVEGDVAGLRELIERSVRGLQRGEYTERQMDGALGHALGVDTQLVKDGTYFVAEPAGEPERMVGCGGWSYRRTLFGSDGGPGREAQRMEPAVDAAKIRAIFVHPEWARRGLGTVILERCEAEARKAGFRRAEMGSTLTGVPLYELRGYRRVKDVAVPLPNGEVLPIVHMEKEL